jgi:hypothetical protein
MPHLLAKADRIDYWIRRQVVPCPPQSKVNSARDRRVALTAIGKTLGDQYDALASPIPPQLAALVKQLEARKPSRLVGTATGRSQVVLGPKPPSGAINYAGS